MYFLGPWLIDWLLAWLLGWLLDCFLDWLVDWLLWLVACLIAYLIGWLIDWLVGWLLTWLVGWLVDCRYFLLGWRDQQTIHAVLPLRGQGTAVWYEWRPNARAPWEAHDLPHPPSTGTTAGPPGWISWGFHQQKCGFQMDFRGNSSANRYKHVGFWKLL